MNRLWAKYPTIQIMIQSYLGFGSNSKMSEKAKKLKGKITHFNLEGNL